MNLKHGKNPEVWHQLNRLLMGIIFFVAAIGGVLTFYPEWNRRNELAAQLEEEQAKLAAEQLLQKQRSRDVTLLQTDPEYVEIIARDKIDVMREGETIFRLDGNKAIPVKDPRPSEITTP